MQLRILSTLLFVYSIYAYAFVLIGQHITEHVVRHLKTYILR